MLGLFKDKCVSLFNTNTPKQTVYGRGKKLSKPKIQKQSGKSNIIVTRIHFIVEKTKENKNLYII